jgi:hypothetical protein
MPLRPDLDVRLTGHDVDCLIEVLEYVEGNAGSYSGKVRHCVEMLGLRSRASIRRDNAIAATLGPEAARTLGIRD